MRHVPPSQFFFLQAIFLAFTRIRHILEHDLAGGKRIHAITRIGRILWLLGGIFPVTRVPRSLRQEKDIRPP